MYTFAAQNSCSNSIRSYGITIPWYRSSKIVNGQPAANHKRGNLLASSQATSSSRLKSPVLFMVVLWWFSDVDAVLSTLFDNDFT